MSARKGKFKLEDIPTIAKMEFVPIKELESWDGATHAEWRFTSEGMRLAALIAGKVCLKDRAAIQIMVRELASDDDLGGVRIMLDSLQDGIERCKALTKLLEGAQARPLGCARGLRRHKLGPLHAR
jgi:hypothetical protein